MLLIFPSNQNLPYWDSMMSTGLRTEDFGVSDHMEPKNSLFSFICQYREETAVVQSKACT